jgi:hypothetical protein
VHPVVYIVVGVLIGLFGLAAMLGFILIQTLEGLNGHPIPDTSVHIRETSGNGRIMLNWTKVPVAVSVIGNATGRQYIALMDSQNILWGITSERMGLNAANWTKIMDLGQEPLIDPELCLGYITNGTVGLRLVVGEERYQWVLVDWPDGWMRLEGTTYMKVPEEAGIKEEDLPNHQRVSSFDESGRSIIFNGSTVVVCSYSPGNGDVVRHGYPSLVYREADGKWSNVVILSLKPSGTIVYPCIAGTDLTDLFVLYCVEDPNPQWYCNFIDDGSLMEAGARGLSNP